MQSIEQRLRECPEGFWEKATVRDPLDCWPWHAAKNAKGYGNFRSRSAHVVAYEAANGPVAEGMTIDHLCRNRGCVNPAHLEAVTLQENIRRHAATITHCRRGHPLSGDNIRIEKRTDGVRRRCLACAKINNANRVSASDDRIAALERALEEIEGKARLGAACLGNSGPKFEATIRAFKMLADIARAALTNKGERG